MRPQKVTVTSVTESAPIVLDRRQLPFNVGLGLIFDGAGTATVQHCFDDILAGETPTWFNHATLAAKSANADGNYAFPVTAIRLSVSALGGTAVTLIALQGGPT